MMHDWRGNDYNPGLIDEVCVVCGEQAVRHVCNAEGDMGRTHWHGGIHSLGPEHPSVGTYCLAHGQRVLANNAAIAGSSERPRREQP